MKRGNRYVYEETPQNGLWKGEKRRRETWRGELKDRREQEKKE